MYFFMIVVVVIFITILIFEVNRKEFYKLKRILKFAISLPGPSVFTSIVDALQIACNYKEITHYVEGLTKKYGNVTRVISGTNVFIVLTKPTDYKLVLTNANGIEKSTSTKTWATIIGDGIVRDSGPSHRVRRKIMLPLLSARHLSEYVTFFDNYSTLYADHLEKNVDGPIFDFKPYIRPYAFNIFLASSVGTQGTARKGAGNNELLFWQEELFKDAERKSVTPWLRLNWIDSMTKDGKKMYIAKKIVSDFIDSISPRKAADYMDLQNKDAYTEITVEKTEPFINNYWNRVEQVRNNVTSKSCDVSDKVFLDDVRSVFFAIQNTVTELTCFIILMLAIHTDVQTVKEKHRNYHRIFPRREKLRQEISAMFSNSNVDAERLFHMRYFQTVFKETLRLFPISPVIMRQLTGDVELESCTLPDGCFVMIPIVAIHRNPTYWDKPLEFIPERFSSEKSSSLHRYAFIPFGTGLRDCPGQRFTYLSVSTIIVNLVRRFRFVTITNFKDIETTIDLVQRLSEVKVSISRA